MSAPSTPSALLEGADLKDIVRDLAARPEAWEHLVRHDEAERVFECLHRDDDLEVWLICWMPGHDTGFHDHDDAQAAITVAQGSVRELRLSLGREPIERRVREGELFEVEQYVIHRVVHAGDGPAVTIHAYSPPLERMGQYEEGPHGELLRRSQSAVEELRHGTT